MRLCGLLGAMRWGGQPLRCVCRIFGATERGKPLSNVFCGPFFKTAEGEKSSLSYLWASMRQGGKPLCCVCMAFPTCQGREILPVVFVWDFQHGGGRNRTYVGFDVIGRETSLMRRRGATLSFVSGLFFQHGRGEILPVMGFDTMGREICLGCLGCLIRL